MPEEVKQPDLLVLPEFIRSREQVHTLITEILGIEDFLYKSRVRESGTKMNLPKTTPELDTFAETNGRNVLQHNQRMELANFLRRVYKQAPEIIIFVRSYDAQVAEGIIRWFRTNVHAQTLVNVRESSKLGVGCVLRIKHKTYDLTLNEKLSHANTVLAQELTAV